MSSRREPLDPADATKLVLDQMRAVLDNPELSEDDHFFDWGGDSILAERGQDGEPDWTVFRESFTAGCRRSMAATSPGSIRYPRILT